MIGHWIVFGLIFLLIPFVFAYFKLQMEKKIKPNEEQKKNANLNIGKMIFFWWLLDLFYMAIFNEWLIWQFIFGGLTMLIVFYNLTIAFIYGKNINSVTRWALLQDFIVGVGLTVYLLYMAPNKELQSILIPIISAIYGGLLTLVGVAWTIKNNNKDRQADLERIENERKEDERKKYRPFVNVYAGNNLQGLPSTEPIMAIDWLKNTEDVSNSQTEKLVVANNIRNCCFANTDFANFYVYGIKVNGAITSFKSYRYIRKERYFQINFNGTIYTEKPIEEISLILEDMLGNIYELKLEFSVNHAYQQIVINGNEPTIFLCKREDLK